MIHTVYHFQGVDYLIEMSPVGVGSGPVIQSPLQRSSAFRKRCHAVHLQLPVWHWHRATAVRHAQRREQKSGRTCRRVTQPCVRLDDRSTDAARPSLLRETQSVFPFHPNPSTSVSVGFRHRPPAWSQIRRRARAPGGLLREGRPEPCSRTAAGAFALRDEGQEGGLRRGRLAIPCGRWFMLLPLSDPSPRRRPQGL